MKNQKHTQGEWEYCPSETDRKHKFAIIADYGTRLIADIYKTHGKEADVDEANAKLIAAAPNLLDACQKVIKVGKGCAPSVEYMESLIEICEKATQKATL